jgi:YHS domain-containing protein
MLRLLMWLVLGYVIFKIVKGFIASRQEPEQPAPTEAETFQDPVCGVYVAADDAVIGRVEGEKIHFCSMACLEKYRERLEQHTP